MQISNRKQIKSALLSLITTKQKILKKITPSNYTIFYLTTAAKIQTLHQLSTTLYNDRTSNLALFIDDFRLFYQKYPLDRDAIHLARNIYRLEDHESPHTIFTTLFPQSTLIDIHWFIPAGMRRNKKNSQIELIATPITLCTLLDAKQKVNSHYSIEDIRHEFVFIQGWMFDLTYLCGLEFRFQQDIYRLLQIHYPLLAHMIYTRNHDLKTLRNNMEQTVIYLPSPQHMIKQLIERFINGGERVTRRPVASIDAQLAYTEFKIYLESLPSELSRQLKTNLQNIIHHLDEGNCVEIAANQLKNKTFSNEPVIIMQNNSPINTSQLSISPTHDDQLLADEISSLPHELYTQNRIMQLIYAFSNKIPIAHWLEPLKPEEQQQLLTQKDHFSVIIKFVNQLLANHYIAQAQKVLHQAHLQEHHRITTEIKILLEQLSTEHHYERCICLLMILRNIFSKEEICAFLFHYTDTKISKNSLFFKILLYCPHKIETMLIIISEIFEKPNLWHFIMHMKMHDTYHHHVISHLFHHDIVLLENLLEHAGQFFNQKNIASVISMYLQSLEEIQLISMITHLRKNTIILLKIIKKYSNKQCCNKVMSDQNLQLLCSNIKENPLLFPELVDTITYFADEQITMRLFAINLSNILIPSLIENGQITILLRVLSQMTQESLKQKYLTHEYNMSTDKTPSKINLLHYAIKNKQVWLTDILHILTDLSTTYTPLKKRFLQDSLYTILSSFHANTIHAALRCIMSLSDAAIKQELLLEKILRKYHVIGYITVHQPDNFPTLLQGINQFIHPDQIIKIFTEPSIEQESILSLVAINNPHFLPTLVDTIEKISNPSVIADFFKKTAIDTNHAIHARNLLLTILIQDSNPQAMPIILSYYKKFLTKKHYDALLQQKIETADVQDSLLTYAAAHKQAAFIPLLEALYAASSGNISKDLLIQIRSNRGNRHIFEILASSVQSPSSLIKNVLDNMMMTPELQWLLISQEDPKKLIVPYNHPQLIPHFFTVLYHAHTQQTIAEKMILDGFQNTWQAMTIQHRILLCQGMRQLSFHLQNKILQNLPAQNALVITEKRVFKRTLLHYRWDKKNPVEAKIASLLQGMYIDSCTKKQQISMAYLDFKKSNPTFNSDFLQKMNHAIQDSYSTLYGALNIKRYAFFSAPSKIAHSLQQMQLLLNTLLLEPSTDFIDVNTTINDASNATEYF